MGALTEERILGVPVDGAAFEEAVDLLVARLEAGETSVAVAVNPEKVLAARANPWLLRFLEGATLRFADGVGIVWASRRGDGAVRSRVTGIDLFLRLAAVAAGRGWSVFLLGARPGVAENAAEALAGQFEGLRVAGFRDGYFPLDEGAAVARTVRQSGADILFVAMGSPRQEHWLWEHVETSGARLAMGVGGGFDVVAGRVRRAPGWIRRAGLEWLYRTLSQPRSRYRRLGNLILFVWAVMREGRRPSR